MSGVSKIINNKMRIWKVNRYHLRDTIPFIPAHLVSLRVPLRSHYVPTPCLTYEMSVDEEQEKRVHDVSLRVSLIRDGIFSLTSLPIGRLEVTHHVRAVRSVGKILPLE